MVTVTLLLSGCDCNQHVTGIVLDLNTNEPIAGAYVQNSMKNKDHSFTDSLGRFEIKSISGGFRKCPPMNVAVTKNDYEIKLIDIESNGHDTIYLERIQ